MANKFKFHFYDYKKPRWMQNRNRNNNGYKRTSVEENAIMKLILFISVLWDTSRGCTVHCTVG